eukprot:2179117-Rhodomonas_salina.4
MPGTDTAYRAICPAPMPCYLCMSGAHLSSASSTFLCACSAMGGTESGYTCTRAEDKKRWRRTSQVPYCPTRLQCDVQRHPATCCITLQNGYAISSTDGRYLPTHFLHTMTGRNMCYRPTELLCDELYQAARCGTDLSASVPGAVVPDVPKRGCDCPPARPRLRQLRRSPQEALYSMGTSLPVLRKKKTGYAMELSALGNSVLYRLCDVWYHSGLQISSERYAMSGTDVRLWCYQAVGLVFTCIAVPVPIHMIHMYEAPYLLCFCLYCLCDVCTALGYCAMPSLCDVRY